MEGVTIKVVKRNGSIVDFDKRRIKNAIIGANNEVDDIYKIWEGDIDVLVDEVIQEVKYETMLERDKNVSVEKISSITELVLMRNGYYEVGRKYIKYRYQRQLVREIKKRDEGIMELLDGTNEELNVENSNKDVRLISTTRDYMAGEVSKDIVKMMYDEDIIAAHEAGIIHLHDTDYISCRMNNCGLVNLEDMLQNGTAINGTLVEKPHSFRTACTITTQIVAQVASSQYGGQTITLAHLAPFVDVSRQKIRKQVEKEVDMLAHPILQAHKKDTYIETINKIVEDRLKQEIKDGIQTLQYQLITLNSTNGQSPFVTVFMYIDEVPEGQTRDDLVMIIEEMLHQRIQGVKNTQGAYITVAFPKLIYCLDEDNCKEGTKYWWLTKLATECSAKRLVPDYISAKMMRELKGDVYPCMGCRSFLTPDPVNHQYYGRFNQGVVTISLPDVAISSSGDMDKFWETLEERLGLCYRALMTRHNRLLGTKADVAPVLWMNGAYARLNSGETIDKLLYDNYSTISLGYAGLYECVKYMTGHSHTEEEGHDFAIKVMQSLNDHCTKWRSETNISFSLYGSPIESTTYKFAKCLQKRFGVIEGITDKKYVTNSYHVTPSEPIDAFSKLHIESEFQALSPGGAISYVETPNMTKNVDALLDVIKYIYDNIMYAEINTTTSYCQLCGCIDLKMEDDLKFHCPQCGNDDFNKMNIALRICGYISTNPFNEGRAQDIHDRVYHLGME